MRSTDEEFAGATGIGFPTESAVERASRSSKGTAPRAVYIRENSVEDYLRTQVKKRRDRCVMEKHVSPGKRGVPDDLITWGYPLCMMELIETKAPKGERKAHQTRDHNKRAKYGIKVHTLYTRADVDAYFAVMDKLMSLT